MRKTLTVAAIVAFLMATAVAIDGWRRALRSEAQLHLMHAQIEHLAAESHELRDRIDVDPLRPHGVVYVDGAITRPGVYQLPEGGRLTAARLISAAGGSATTGDDRDAIHVRVLRAETIDSGDRQREFLLSQRESEAFALLPDDHVLIEARKTAAPE